MPHLGWQKPGVNNGSLYRLLSPWDSPGKNTGVDCHCLLKGNLPDPGMEPASFTSPALAGGFFTTSATWEPTGKLCLFHPT